MLNRWATVSDIVSKLVSYIYIDDYLAPSASAQVQDIGRLLQECGQMLEYSKECLELHERTMPLADFAAFLAQHRALQLNWTDESRVHRSLISIPGTKRPPDRPIETIDLEAFRNRVVELHTVIMVYDENVCSVSKHTAGRNSPQLAPAFPDEEAPTISTLTLVAPLRKSSQLLG
ncbi:hypothetical protein FRC06_005772, partial [Ceratobasidium sp. 370]